MTSSEYDALVEAARRRYRDLLANMAKWGIIGDEDLWFRMRDLRNRIAHDYLPEQLRDIYAAIHDAYGPELLRLREHIERG